MLERRSGYAGNVVLKSACRSAAARLRDDPTTEAACHLIDRNFGEAADWAVLHDLRLRIDGHAVHFNHVMISDMLEVVCIDSRYMNYGLHFEQGGVCRIVMPDDSRIVASPLTRLARDLRKLGTELQRLEQPRNWLGTGPRAAVQGIVLSDPAFRLTGQSFDSRTAVCACASNGLYPMLWKRERRQFHSALDRLSPDRLIGIAEQLAERHESTVPDGLLGNGFTRVNERTLELIEAASLTHGRSLRG